MNREAIIACCYKAVKIPHLDRTFISLHPDMSSETKQEPEFKLQNESLNSLNFNDRSMKDSLTNTVSFCSTLSRTPMDRVLFRDILKRRKNYHVFSDLEKDDTETKKWYYIEERNHSYHGPLSCTEMDQRFHLGQINEKTKVKVRDDDDYYFFGRLVKRYYKNVISQQLDLQSHSTALSNKVFRFKKGVALSKTKRKVENFQTKNREERVVGMLPKPNFLHLKDMLPEESDEDEESCYRRIRSNTMMG